MIELENALPIAISTIALLVSVLTFVLTRFFQSKDRKQALTVEMWQRWDDALLRDSRIVFWNALEKIDLAAAEKDGGVHYEELDADALRALNDVEQFLDGLGKLRCSGQLDEKLFRQLFEPNLSQWTEMSVVVMRDDSERIRNLDKVRELYSRLA